MSQKTKTEFGIKENFRPILIPPTNQTVEETKKHRKS